MKSWLKTIAVSTFITTSASAFADSAGPSNADWYLHLDVKALEQSAIAPEVNVDAKDGIKVLKSLFGDKVVDNTQFVTLYGGIKGEENKNAILQGNYKDSKTQLVSALTKLGLSEQKSVNGTTVYFGKVNELSIDFDRIGESNEADVVVETTDDSGADGQTFYVAFKADNRIMVSESESEIQSWTSANSAWVSNSQGNLFEVVVDVEKSMLHGGVNMDEAAEFINFESISAKQIQQASVSYKESAGVGDLEIGLKAANDATATQVLQVAKGLLALKILSEKNADVINMLNTIEFSQNGGEVVMKMTGTVDSVKALLSAHGH